MSGIKDKPIYKVIWSVVSVIIAICAIWAVMSQAKDFSFSNLLELIRSGNKIYLVITFLCIPAYIIAEGEALRVIIKKLHDRKITFGQSFVYSAADIYFSAITPSATDISAFLPYLANMLMSVSLLQKKLSRLWASVPVTLW